MDRVFFVFIIVSLSQPVLLVVIESVYGREVFKAIEYK